MLYEQWWLDENYHYNDIPFIPKNLEAEQITELCVESRREFYSVSSIIKRMFAKSNYSNGFMLRNYLPINWMHRRDVSGRNGYPLGDENYKGRLIKVGEL